MTSRTSSRRVAAPVLALLLSAGVLAGCAGGEGSRGAAATSSSGAPSVGQEAVTPTPEKAVEEACEPADLAPMRRYLARIDFAPLRLADLVEGADAVLVGQVLDHGATRKVRSWGRMHVVTVQVNNDLTPGALLYDRAETSRFVQLMVERSRVNRAELRAALPRGAEVVFFGERVGRTGSRAYVAGPQGLLVQTCGRLEPAGMAIRGPAGRASTVDELESLIREVPWKDR